MKSYWMVALALVTILVSGCATQNSERSIATVTTAHCVDPASRRIECHDGLSALNKQSVAAERCVETILLRGTRHGALHRTVLC